MEISTETSLVLGALPEILLLLTLLAIVAVHVTRCWLELMHVRSQGLVLDTRETRVQNFAPSLLACLGWRG